MRCHLCIQPGSSNAKAFKTFALTGNAFVARSKPNAAALLCADNVVRQANEHLARQIEGMDAGNSMYAVQATLIRGDLHMTPAQASPLQFIYVEP